MSLGANVDMRAFEHMHADVVIPLRLSSRLPSMPLRVHPLDLLLCSLVSRSPCDAFVTLSPEFVLSRSFVWSNQVFDVKQPSLLYGAFGGADMESALIAANMA